jgi:hypothetical protein
MSKGWLILMGWLLPFASWTQTTDTLPLSYVTLTPVVVDSRLNVAHFLQQVQSDSSFYKAFKNLRILEHQSIHDIQMRNRSGKTIASMHGKSRQTIQAGCRSMQWLEQSSTGDFFQSDSQYNYYTASLYASLFLTKGKVCGETNLIGNREQSIRSLSGMAKHRAQLKQLLFNPGQPVPGIPLVGKKTSLFHPDVASRYNITLDLDVFNGKTCWLLTQQVKPGSESDVLIDEMTTWFDEATLEVLRRSYSLRYNAGIYDFQVNMDVEMTNIGDYLVPQLIRYVGDWKILFKKRERGVFTTTFSDFKMQRAD